MAAYNCANCLFFWTIKPGDEQGQCRRNPPVATVTQYVSDTLVQGDKVYQVLNGVIQNLLPVVNATFLCGNYILKAEQSSAQPAPMPPPAEEPEDDVDVPIAVGGLTAPKLVKH